jgi:hypothetical protein
LDSPDTTDAARTVDTLDRWLFPGSKSAYRPVSHSLPKDSIDYRLLGENDLEEFLNDTVVPDDPWRERLVHDRHGRGGMITLDSLQKRVAKQRILLSSSKVAVMLDMKDREYLDSLLRAYGIEP